MHRNFETPFTHDGKKVTFYTFNAGTQVNGWFETPVYHLDVQHELTGDMHKFAFDKLDEILPGSMDSYFMSNDCTWVKLAW